MTTPAASHRSRRIDDALGQLVESLVPVSSAQYDEDLQPDARDFARVEDERRVRRALEHAYDILETYDAEAADPNPEETGILLPDTETINSAPDMIKRKLLQENESPDRAIQFNSLYSRMRTQSALSQKCPILYLLYRLGQATEFERHGALLQQQHGDVAYGSEPQSPARTGPRSPARDGYHFESSIYRERVSGKRIAPESIAPESSASVAAYRRMQEEEEGEEKFEPPLPSSAHYDRRQSVTSDGTETRVGAQHQQPPTQRRVASGSTRETKPLARDRQQNADSQLNQQQPPQQPSQLVLPRSPLHAPNPSKQQELLPQAPPMPQVSERDILRDLPFVLQGVSSTNLQFEDETLKLPPCLSVAMLSIMHTIAEPCLLYRKLSAFVQTEQGGLIDQGLRSAVSHELRSYLGLVAALETEIRTELHTQLQDPIAGDSDVHEHKKVNVTLKKCVVWLRDATMALRLLSLIVEETSGKVGGHVISVIHGFSVSNGDPFVNAFAERLLGHVTRPFYGMLQQWIYDGELSDPYGEFFVVQPEQRPTADPRRIATSVWDDKYKLDEDMVPSNLTQEFAKKVFLIGKSLNFIRYGCSDSAWVVAYSKEASKELRYGDTAALEESIDDAYKRTMARLIFLMDTRFKLFEHLYALKRYLLLGQGDFIALLMESLASNLERPANSQYRHTLTAQLENAIRSSNAQYDAPDVLRLLDARMLELSHGESGWDCFTLEYKIDAPVNVVITPWGSTQYLKVFNFLWRVKRVEFALSSTWRRCITGARGVLGAVDDKVGQDWKRVRCTLAEMNHFISQLQYYILFEVIESSWDQLQTAIHQPNCTLDDVIQAHTKYLNAITHKGLLGGSRNKSSSRDEPFLTQLHHILKVMLTYKDAVDGLYASSVAEYSRRQKLTAELATRAALERSREHLGGGRARANTLASSELGTHITASRHRSHSISHAGQPELSDFLLSSHSPDVSTLTAQDLARGETDELTSAETAEEAQVLSALRQRLRELAREFRDRLITLLSDLAYQPDVDMRFLALVMNFNDVYPVRRKRRDGTGGHSSSKERKRTAEATASSQARQKT
ncbi:Microtubule-nucleating Tub4p (gamma-tubulin) complex component [Ascosphaera acerosa]|nr:Microtubule-nucleating Tub4p (gamma-tubulin) complex component [Ascosphaera acerosa]